MSKKTISTSSVTGMNAMDAPFEGGSDRPVLDVESIHLPRGRVRHWLNYGWEDLQRGEENRKPSQTVPNQAMSIREIFERFAQGKPIGDNGMRFTGDETIDISRMDKTEIAQFRLDLKNRITELRSDLNSQAKDHYARLVENQKRADELLELEAQQKELEARIKEKKSADKPDDSSKEDKKS